MACSPCAITAPGLLTTIGRTCSTASIARKRILEAHDGTVSIEPAPGGGTIASMKLPSIPIDVSPAAAASPA